jgi:hypothetical protein
MQAFLVYLAVDWECMEYPRILNLIDEYLDRLTEARQVLLELDSASEKVQKGGPQVVSNKRALKTAARERQVPLAFAVAPSQLETPRQKSKSKTDKRVGNGAAKASADSQPSLFVQDDLFSQEQHRKPLREELAMDAKVKKPLVAIQSSPVSVKVRAQREPTRRYKKEVPALAVRALGGTISAAPVFIPAERVRQEHSQKVTNKGTKEEASESASAAPLTVEMLTQRWVQGLTS